MIYVILLKYMTNVATMDMTTIICAIHADKSASDFSKLTVHLFYSQCLASCNKKPTITS